jgi:hypothetical protein
MVMSLIKTALVPSRAASPCSTAIVIPIRSITQAASALKDRYLGRFELYHFLSDEEGDVELFGSMLDRETCDEASIIWCRMPKQSTRLIGPVDDGCCRSGACRCDKGSDSHRRLTAVRPPRWLPKWRSSRKRRRDSR